MSTIKEIENMWEKSQVTITPNQAYDQAAFAKIVRSRTKKHTNTAMQYFWGAFALQIGVYALFGHVIIKYAFNIETLLLSAAGVLLYIPFTVMLMTKYKRMALVRPDGNNVTSLFAYVMNRYHLLNTFYKFKRHYELVLIPVSSLIGVLIIFNLYVPGGVLGNVTGAAITFCITLMSCIIAIRLENKKNFETPLEQFRELLEEFKFEGS
jgi:hypothetical protein